MTPPRGREQISLELQSPNVTEDFYYDALNRLDRSTRNGVTNDDVTLDAIGNISWRQNVGNYTYHASKKRAVIAAGSNSYGYDANGNMTSRNGSNIGYTSYNLPDVIVAGSCSRTLGYGARRNRTRQVASESCVQHNPRMASDLPMLAAFALLASPGAISDADLATQVQALRSQGCAGHAGNARALNREPALDRVAEILASGTALEAALRGAGYRADRSKLLELSGDARGIRRLLESRGCADILDPDYRLFGIASRSDRAWIVLVAPFEPPEARDSEAVASRMLGLVNEARSAARRCGRRRFDAVPPLVLSNALYPPALEHARDMAARSALGHAGGDGSLPALRVARAGYAWRFVGENVAAGQPTPERVVAEWLASPGHCAILMDPDFTETAVAYAVNRRSEKLIYWVQIFAAPAR